MTTTSNPNVPETADPSQDLAAASRAAQAVRGGRPTGPVDRTTFFGQVSFLTTIGYLTNDQAQALITWFLNRGATPLPNLPGPDNIPSPKMYDILATSIRFNTPKDPAPADADIFDWFSGALDAIGDLITTTTDGIAHVLDSGTALVQAGTQLVMAIGTVLAA